MTRPFAAFAALIGLLLGPLGLAAPTAWLLIPVHAVFAVTISLGAAWDGLAGAPERARRWGFGYLLATLWMVACLQVGATVRGASMWYWGGPWLIVALWAWMPPLAAGLAGWVGEHRRLRRVRGAVRRRRAEG